MSTEAKPAESTHHPNTKITLHTNSGIEDQHSPFGNPSVPQAGEAFAESVIKLMRPEHVAFAENHTEVGNILGAFLKALLAEKPKNTEQFAARYFATADHKVDIKECDPLIITGPSGSDKVKLNDSTEKLH